MLTPAAKRPTVLAVIITFTVGILLLLHQQSGRIPLPAVLRLQQAGYDPVALRLSDTCNRNDPFDVEYGRTNIRMSRAYEGGYSVKLQR